MRSVAGIALILLLATNSAFPVERIPASERVDQLCETSWWALSPDKEWVFLTCELGGNGLVDDFSLDTEVFVMPSSGGDSLAIAARDWSPSPRDNVLWYIDDAAMVRRLMLPEAIIPDWADSASSLPALDLSPLEPVRVLGLSISAAAVEVMNPIGDFEICSVVVLDDRPSLSDCHKPDAGSSWRGGAPVSAEAFVMEGRLDTGSYRMEFWKINPLEREWVNELPVDVEPRGIIPSSEDEFLVVGCPGDPENRPFLAVFDVSGNMDLVEVAAGDCTLDLLNPCPAVIGGLWEKGGWQVWLEPGPRPSKMEYLEIDSRGARCFSGEQVPWIRGHHKGGKARSGI